MLKLSYFLLLSCYLSIATAKEPTTAELLKLPFEKLYNLPVTKPVKSESKTKQTATMKPAKAKNKKSKTPSQTKTTDRK